MSKNNKEDNLIPFKNNEYKTIIRTEKSKLTDLSHLKDKSLEKSNDNANRHIIRLREQAKMLLDQAENIEFHAKIREQIHEARINFKPAVNKHYFLYRNKENLRISLIAPEEWDQISPYGICLAKIKQLLDLTWEISETY